MSFESHEIVKEYLAELEDIIVVRDQIQKSLDEALDTVALIRTDYGTNEEYKQANQKVKELELRLSTTTSRGQRCMYKIDKLNGVR